MRIQRGCVDIPKIVGRIAGHDGVDEAKRGGLVSRRIGGAAIDSPRLQQEGGRGAQDDDGRLEVHGYLDLVAGPVHAVGSQGGHRRDKGRRKIGGSRPGRRCDPEHLDAVAAAVGDGGDPGRADGDGPGIVKLPVVHPQRPERICERAVGVEYLHAVVELVGDGDRPRRCYCDACGAAKLADRRSRRSELECERAVGVEYLHAVVVLVGDGDHPRRADCDAGGAPVDDANGAPVGALGAAVCGSGEFCSCDASKLAVSRSPCPERKGERAVGVEYLHAVVAGVGDGDHPRRGDGDAGGGVKLRAPQF